MDAFEVKFELASQSLWYFHWPICNCSIAPSNTPLETRQKVSTNGTVLTLTSILATNQTTLATITFNSASGVQILSLLDLNAVALVTGVQMAFLYNNNVVNGETVTFTPFPDGAFVASTTGVYLTRVYSFGYTVYGTAKLAGPSGSVIISGAPATILQRWGNLNDYGASLQLEDSWEISAGVSGATRPTFVMDLSDELDNFGVRAQLGGILWLDNDSQQELGTANGESAYAIVPNSGCSKFTITIPTSRGTLSGTLSDITDYGGGCSFDHGSVLGSLTLGSTSYTVSGVALEFHCASSLKSATGCADTPIPSSTTLTCSPSSVLVNEPSTCTATVTSGDASVPVTSSVAFTATPAGSGTFNSSSCTLSSGVCSVSYLPSPGKEGTSKVTAAYGGDINHGTSSASTTVAATVRPSTTTTACAPSYVVMNGQSTCTATVADSGQGVQLVPTGTVSFTAPAGDGAFGSSTCLLSGGTCSVTYTAGISTGTIAVMASYGGDTDHSSSSGTASIVVVTARTTSTALSCVPSTLGIKGVSSCTAIVTDTGTGAPIAVTGTVSFTLSPASAGVLSSPTCTLVVNGSSSSCSSIFTAEASSGSVQINAAYSGDSVHLSSGNSASLTLRLRQVSGVLSCSPSPAVVAGSTTCTITITDVDTGTASVPAGTVTFTTNSSGRFTGNPCSLSGAVNVASCQVVYSPSLGSEGHHLITAAYAGDSVHMGVTSTLGILVTKDTPSLSTILSSSAITIGGSISDSATLSGATSTAGGSITFYYSSTNSCPATGATQVGSSDGVSGPGVYSSTSVTFNTAGTYYWYAAYSGDANNSPVIGGCEQLTVTGPITHPTISTVLSSSAIVAGGSVSDSATLSGATGNAGGRVTYGYFTDSSCSGTETVYATVTVSNDVVPTSGPISLDKVGTYYFVASYTGDANNSPAVSQCTAEEAVVNTASPSVSTSLSASSIPVGGSVYDTATLSGADPVAGGTVTYRLFSGSSCQGSTTTLSVVTVSGASVPNSVSQTFSNAGQFSFDALYSGDSNDLGSTSPCEPLSVVPLTPSLSTILSSSAITIGGSISDSATLSGATSTAGGSITFYYSSTNSCPATGATQVGSSDGVSGPGVYSSTSVTFNTAGTYYWYAAYSGDANNHNVVSRCETLTVTAIVQDPTKVSLTSPATMITGTVVTFTATVTDTATSPSTPTGTVSWSDNDGGGSFSQSVCTLSSVSSSTATCQTSYTVSQNAGPLGISLSYGGDSFHKPSSSTKTLKVLNTITSVSPTTAKQVADNAQPQVFTATVTDQRQSPTTPTGTITWNDGGKGGTFTPTSCVLSGTTASATCSVTYTPTAADPVGTIKVTASYQGDSSHSTSSGSASLQVGKRITTVSVSPSASSVVEGTQVVLTVTITDSAAGTGSPPTGSVTWTSSVSGGTFSSATCTLSSSGTNTSICSVTYTAPTTTGKVTITAKYSGDSTHSSSSGKSTLTIT